MCRITFIIFFLVWSLVLLLLYSKTELWNGDEKEVVTNAIADYRLKIFCKSSDNSWSLIFQKFKGMWTALLLVPFASAYVQLLYPPARDSYAINVVDSSQPPCGSANSVQDGEWFYIDFIYIYIYGFKGFDYSKVKRVCYWYCFIEVTKNFLIANKIRFQSVLFFAWPANIPSLYFCFCQVEKFK